MGEWNINSFLDAIYTMTDGALNEPLCKNSKIQWNE